MGDGNRIVIISGKCCSVSGEIIVDSRSQIGVRGRFIRSFIVTIKDGKRIGCSHGGSVGFYIGDVR